MSVLTDTQTHWLQAELGVDVDLPDLQARFDRLESIRDVAIEVLRERRAAMIEKPMQSELSGVGSVNWSANIKALDARIAALVDLPDDPSEPGSPVIDEQVDSGFEQVYFTRTVGR